MKLPPVAILLLVVLPAASVHAGLRSPQVPVSGTALQSFFTSHGQSINVSAGQQDLQRFSIPAYYSFGVHTFGDRTTSFGVYNASATVPPLYQLMPGAAGDGWFVVCSFRTGPDRLIVNLFDNNSAFVSTNTYLGADPTDLGFYDEGAGGTFYTQDARNPDGAPNILVFSATGALAGSTWFACETSTGPGGDFADFIVLLDLAFTPVPTTRSSWSLVKALYH